MSENKNVIDVLIERGFISQSTDMEAVKKLFSKPGQKFYIGFDPTADSLHVGHLIQLMLMAHLQKAGHIPYALLGGGTGMIGDPSGRSDMRKIMSRETIEHNISRFKEQMQSIIDFSDGKAYLVNNADWLLDLNYIEYLREIGPHFSINRMLAAEAYKTRLEEGLTFLEFNYMTIQAYDFYRLYTDHGVKVQFGGSDQWSNIIAGSELIRRKTGNQDSYGVTTNLLIKSDGEKMGKTSSGALWLDPDKTSPYDFYQYWRNIDDADVINCMRLLTFIPMDEIREYAKLEGQDVNKAKKRLAYEVTKIVHGEEAAKASEKQAKEIFHGEGRSDDMDTTVISKEDLAKGLPLLATLTEVGLTKSNSEARRLIKQNGIKINDEAINDTHYDLSEDDLVDGEIILQRGKKNFYRLLLED